MTSITPLLPTLEAAPVRDTAGVLSVMRGIELQLAPGEVAVNGIAWFNRLYLAVTERVIAAEQEFQRPDYIATLDVAFANLYFSALKAFAQDERSPHIPRAWWPVLAARDRAKAQGEALNALGGPECALGGAYLEALDGVVGLAGRGLLLTTR